MQQTNKKGLITALSCYFIWGLLPIYWGLLHHISAYSVLAHRIIGLPSLCPLWLSD